MKELTKKQKIYVLKEMIRYYTEVKGSCNCMCELIEMIVKVDLKLEICQWSFDDFYEHRPPRIMMTGYWFHYGDRSPRLNYCKKILKLIEKNP